MPGARGRVGRQSTYFSPISDWGRIWQVASCAEVLEAGVGDLHHDHGLARNRLRLAVFVAVDLAGQGDVDGLDFADVGAGDPDLLASDHERAVVEDAADDVGVVFFLAEASSRTATTTAARSSAISAFFPALFILPFALTARVAGRRGCIAEEVTPEPVKGGSTKGFDPSAADWVAAPGQRRLTVSAEPSDSYCWLGGIGSSSPSL